MPAVPDSTSGDLVFKGHKTDERGSRYASKGVETVMQEVTVDQPGKFCHRRLFEWAMSLALFLIGVELVLWPDAIEVGKLQFMLDLVGTPVFTVYYLYFGIARMVALITNGTGRPYSAYVRAMGALAGAWAWFQMAVSLIIAQLHSGQSPSILVPLLLVLVGMEMHSVPRALDDARR